MCSTITDGRIRCADANQTHSVCLRLHPVDALGCAEYDGCVYMFMLGDKTMIITRKTAKQLIKAGKAHCVGHTTTASDWAQRDYGHTYAIIDRYDEQRTDHCIDDEETLLIDSTL